MSHTPKFKRGDHVRLNTTDLSCSHPSTRKLTKEDIFTVFETSHPTPGYTVIALPDGVSGWFDALDPSVNKWNVLEHELEVAPAPAVTHPLGFLFPGDDAPTPAPDALVRKQTPVASGVIDYFPDAILAIARVSFAGNEQHNPGTPLHWDRSKSGDESDALMRHFIQRGTLDTDGLRHSAKVAWRALALLQKEIEAAGI